MLEYARMDSSGGSLAFYGRLVNDSARVLAGNSNISCHEIIGYLETCRRLLGNAYSSQFGRRSLRRNLLLPAFRDLYNKALAEKNNVGEINLSGNFLLNLQLVQKYLQSHKIPLANFVREERNKKKKGERNKKWTCKSSSSSCHGSFNSCSPAALFYYSGQFSKAVKCWTGQLIQRYCRSSDGVTIVSALDHSLRICQNSTGFFLLLFREKAK